MLNLNDHIIGHRNRIKQRFLNHKDSLFDYELLELLLFYALPRKDVKPLAKTLINHFGCLKHVLQATTNELKEIKGLSKHTIILLQLILPLSKKVLEHDLKKKPIVKNWAQLLDFCFLKLSSLKQEQVFIIYLNTKNFIIKEEVLSDGSLNYALVDFRTLMKKVLNLGASSIILAHNHPSGDNRPSKEDIKVTTELFKIAKTLNIFLYDHLIISKTGVYSFRENNLIPE